MGRRAVVPTHLSIVPRLSPTTLLRSSRKSQRGLNDQAPPSNQQQLLHQLLLLSLLPQVIPPHRCHRTLLSSQIHQCHQHMRFLLTYTIAITSSCPGYGLAAITTCTQVILFVSTVISLFDIIGGGRLGTAVKKGFLVGGEDPEAEGSK